MSSGEDTLVTIVVPTFDRQDVLLRCVTSALGQDAAHIEVIVVDDGSTDDTLAQLATIDDVRLTVIAADHAGAPAARNRGLGVASGDWVLFLDSDDWLAEDHVSTLLSAASAAGAGVGACYSGFTSVDARDGRAVARPPVVSRDPCRAILYNNFIAPGSLLVSTDLARELGGYDPALAARQDADFHLRVVGVTSVAVAPRSDTCFVTHGRADRITADKARRRQGFSQLYRKHRGRMTLHHRLYLSKRLLALGLTTRHAPTVLRHLPLGVVGVIARVRPRT